MQLVLHGELDVAWADGLRSEARGFLQDGWDIALDLADVTFIDCAGLHALEDVVADADAHGRHAFVVSPSAAVRRIVELVDEPQLA